MNVLSKAQIGGDRAQFQSGLNALLYFDELYHDTVERAIDLAYEYNRSGSTQRTAERMVRNMLALSVVSKLIVTWAKADDELL
jgi:hypothetical protein